jgi:purine-binding chemotaxis protein CheW
MDFKEDINLNKSEKYLTLLSNNQYFGISIKDIIQIVKMQTITNLPNYPEYIKGVINIRGLIIPVIDMSLCFNGKETEYTEKTCIIITSISDNTIGFIVDSVDEVIEISDDNISDLPEKYAKASSYLKGIANVNNKLVLIVSLENIFNNLSVVSKQGM